MNLNITPIDKISNELAAIDSYLNITMSEEVQGSTGMSSVEWVVETTLPSISPGPGNC
mgnify:CR=1 FL=1